MNGGKASFIFVTPHYSLHSDVAIRSGRALDAFNDPTTRYLELENVRFHQRASAEPVLELDRTVLVKESAQLVILVSEESSNESRVFYATREKKTMHADISLPTVLVQGQVHVKSATDALGFLSIEATSFVPVTNATVFGFSESGQALESPVVLVKKDAISSLSLRREA